MDASTVSEHPTTNPDATTQPAYENGDLLVAYLKQLNIEFVYGIPGGAIEPLYNALARSERQQGPRAVLARHESGAVFMADGYYRNANKLGVCCATTGPGATNALTGIATAYENNIPLLFITAQTATRHFGQKAFQESTDTGIDTVAIFKPCTRYSSMVSHPEQLERKLIAAIMTAFGPHKGPVHLSIPLDILHSKALVTEPSYSLPSLLKTPRLHDNYALQELTQELLASKNAVFILGNGCHEAASTIVQVAQIIQAKILTTPDGKGLINPLHPLFNGIIGFAGHQSATDLLSDPSVDLVIAVGTTLGEWTSNGWDKNTILTQQLIHIDEFDNHLTRSPMARLHVRGHLLTLFQQTVSLLAGRGEYRLPLMANTHLKHLKMEPSGEPKNNSGPVKPQQLMEQLTQIFPPSTKYIIDTGNCFAWAAHYLHPLDRRINERRATPRDSDNRRHFAANLFQCAIEYSSMGWAIGSAIGAAMANRKQPVVAITGDGSWLMSGQEITTAVAEGINVIYIILNDSALGMVKHGQQLAGAEPTCFELPPVNFHIMADAMGADGYLVESYNDLINLDSRSLINKNKPSIIDVRIDPKQVPPMGLRMNVLNSYTTA